MFSLKVIDYLCVVGKLTDKGHNSLLVEETLILFKNNSEKVCFLIHLRTFIIYIFKIKNQFYLLGLSCLLGLNYHSIGRLIRIYSQQIFVSWWTFVQSAPPFISGEWRSQKFWRQMMMIDDDDDNDHDDLI